MLGADLDPVESYEWAWAELHRIEDELAAEAERVAPGAGIEAATALLDETDVVDGAEAYRAWLQEQHDAAIERLDGVHFDIAPQLRTVDATLAIGSSSGSAYYTPPDEAFTRPGRTWWPLGDRDRFAVWAEQTTVFHEGVPGHHLQLGQARVMGEALSRHQRLGGVPGHSEGWALYAERLADELGWFDTPGRRLGMLKGSALRAARVVIDIGLHLDLPLPPAEADRHGPRWTFEVATEVLRDRGRIAAHRLHPEVVRYCGWPAQATAYKLGERAWLAARDEARTRLGAGFDLKRWHTAALALGPVQLDDLAARGADRVLTLRATGRSEQPAAGIVDPAQGVVVERDAGDPAVGGEHPRLRRDRLRGEDPAHRRQHRVPVEQLEVAGELLDPVDLAAALDLDRDRAAGGVPAEDVDRADRGRVLPADQPVAGAEGAGSARPAAAAARPRRRP